MLQSSSPASSGRTPAGERIASALREDILSGRIAAGTRLRQEELAESHGASRIPVREALRSLEAEGLLVMVPNSGAWVQKPSRAEFIEIYRIRERIEPLAIFESCPHLTEAQLDHLDDIQARLEAQKDTSEFEGLDSAFHLGTYAGAQMPQLLGLVDKYRNATRRFRAAMPLIFNSKLHSDVILEHHVMIAALRRRDAQLAADLLEGHIRGTRRLLEASQTLFRASDNVPSDF